MESSNLQVEFFLLQVNAAIKEKKEKEGLYHYLITTEMLSIYVLLCLFH